MSLTYVGQQLMISVGITLITIGLIGNSINVLVFSSSIHYRKSSCAFYLLMSAVFNIIYISMNYIPRFVSQVSKYDLLRYSIVWCKMRSFGVITFPLITLTCSCLATIDQYLSTSQNVHLRRLSQIKLARRMVILLTVVWTIHGVAPLVFNNISPSQTCESAHFGYNLYRIFYLLGLITTIPSSIMILFGYLTYRNLHQTRVLLQQQADRQLIRMILYIICLDLFCLIPYGIQMAYNTITTGWSKDANQLAIERFSFTILTTVTYAYYSVR